ncbi:S-adenosyl-L-methionine-dependent methyltransferase [Lophiostoma macrostomum CBS 122681]|uniref:S-adenosyl-L-methionine-dependent methyltransferase n=1 Tax=Lophiostoma macrostomum CBS 122681 TaxID=1314788 RepID=A0A6A6TC89_9PLEO|nr:S-adenosyl-L-methionine-dependent methyltransferase [Lophiostoma macrostomum CBS 122681]
MASNTTSNDWSVDDTYNGPRSNNEYNRLRVQHEMVKHAMNGELIWAPVNFDSTGFEVLDSATGDGYWLVDAAGTMSPTSKLLGADLAPEHFIEKDSLPKNVELVTHNILEQWPPAFRNRFDLVHQRFVLMALNESQAQTAIRNLFKCVKPGGWIQLHDGDMQTIEDGPAHAAMKKFRTLCLTGWSMMGFSHSPGPSLVSWMRNIGFIAIEERIVKIQCGMRSADKTQGERVIQNLQATLDNMTALAQQLPGFPYSSREIIALKEELAHELRTVGNEYRTHVVWGQKPA